MALILFCLSGPSRGFNLRGLIPDWFAGERLEALPGECREMPLWALDSQLASEIFLVGALQEEGMSSEAKRRDKGLPTNGW